MPNINLIQEQRLAIRRSQRQARAAFFAFVGAAATAAAGAGYTMLESNQLSSEASKLTAELQKLSPVVSETEANLAEIAELEPRLKVLEEAQQASGRWSRVLAHLTTQMPKGTWLTGLRSDGRKPEEPIKLTINGIAQSQDPIGEFIMRVQNAPDLENVALHYTQEKQSPLGKAVDFEVAAELAGTAEKKAKTKSKDGDESEKEKTA